MELALAVAMGASAYAWANAAHRLSKTSPYLGALMALFAALLLWKFWLTL
jgi:hypothetical protein